MLKRLEDYRGVKRISGYQGKVRRHMRIDLMFPVFPCFQVSRFSSSSSSFISSCCCCCFSVSSSSFEFLPPSPPFPLYLSKTSSLSLLLLPSPPPLPPPTPPRPRPQSATLLSLHVGNKDSNSMLFCFPEESDSTMRSRGGFCEGKRRE